jgi:putative lipase involved disintegration of autophagic bodies
MVETQSHSHNTAGHSLGGTFASVIIGNAYRCPTQSQGNL